MPFLRRKEGGMSQKIYSRRELMMKAPIPLEKQYLTFKVLSEGTITIVSTNSSSNRTIYYSTNGGQTWTAISSSTTVTSLGTFNEGDEILVKGNNRSYSNGASYYTHFGGTARVEMRGNFLSLIYGDSFRGKYNTYTTNYGCNSLFRSWTTLVSAKDLILCATTLTSRCYQWLFTGCSSLKEPPQILPATILASMCYYGMFSGCSSLLYAPVIKATVAASQSMYQMFSSCASLTQAPEILLTTVANDCCHSMFANCKKLVSVPVELPATILATGCYNYMFDGCSSITTAPVLPALTLAATCYDRMFRSCSKLRYVKAMFTTTPSTSYTSNWLYGVSESGTFVKNSAAEWDVRGVHGIPNNWTIETADE